jgi:hypothetical protein
MTYICDARYNELIEFQKIHYGAALNKIDVKKNLAELRKYASLSYYCVYRCLPSVNTASPSGQPAGVNLCVTTARYAAKIKHCIVDTVSLVQGAIARGERVLAEVGVTRDATSRIRSVCLFFRAKRSHCVK